MLGERKKGFVISINATLRKKRREKHLPPASRGEKEKHKKKITQKISF